MGSKLGRAGFPLGIAFLWWLVVAWGTSFSGSLPDWNLKGNHKENRTVGSATERHTHIWPFPSAWHPRCARSYESERASGGSSEPGDECLLT